MSKRGLHYNYSPGDHVLCFEPDPKKVKVIYPAKVMEHSVRRTGESGHRMVSYRVHFQGWKASWDREVTEDMLLEDTPFNRELMFRIDEITRRTRRIEEVRERIDRVLSHVGRVRASGKLTSAMDEEAFDWSQVEGILPPPPPLHDGRRGRCGGRKPSTEGNSEDEEDEGSHVENLELHKAFTYTLQPSPLLRRVLEADQQRFMTDPSSTALAAGPDERSVVQFLEAYLQAFVLRPARHPSSSSHSQSGAPSFWTEEYMRCDRSLRLSFEVCSSLRALFDVFLTEELLYSRERPVHTAAGSTGSARRRKEALAANFGAREALETPAEAAQGSGEAPPYALLPPEAKAGKSLPSCVYPAVYLLRLFVLLPDLLESMDLSLCRKAIISRHVSRIMRYMEDTVADWYPQAVEQEDTESEADGAAAATSTSTSSASHAPATRRRKRLSC